MHSTMVDGQTVECIVECIFAFNGLAVETVIAQCFGAMMHYSMGQDDVAVALNL